jgi:type VI secretion system protein VasJ
MDYSKIEQLGVNPIGPDKRAGTKARSNPSFEKLKEEIGKLESLSGKTVNWKRVIKLAIEILNEESKDMLVASYLCVGLFYEEGYKGLKAGLTCYKGLLENFWEEMFPPRKRMKARVSAVVWMAERTEKAAKSIEIEEHEKGAVDQVRQEINELHTLFDEKFEGESVGLAGLRRVLDEHIGRMEVEDEGKKEQIKKEEHKKVAEKTPRNKEKKKKEKTEKEKSAPAGPVEIVNAQDADRALREASNLLRRIAFYQRGEDGTNPLPYRLVRFAAWQKVNQLPINQNNRTMIPPVQEYIKARLNDLMDKGQWQEIINFTETQITDAPFWLDLNYCCVISLSNLGASYKRTQQAVCDELSNFLNRLPGILDFQFSNGTPFASADTRNWIETTVTAPSIDTTVSSQTFSTPAGNGDSDRLEELKATARKLASESKVKDAILLFQQELSGIAHMRQRFIYKLAMAQICFDAGEPKATIAILEELDEVIKRFSLEKWEPALAAGVLHLFWLTFTRLLSHPTEISPDSDHRVEKVYSRLSRLDPVLAFELIRKKKG